MCTKLICACPLLQLFALYYLVYFSFGVLVFHKKDNYGMTLIIMDDFECNKNTFISSQNNIFAIAI